MSVLQLSPVDRTADDAYQTLTLRNRGYLSCGEQDSLRHTALLIAGCGQGSVAAEVALRTGFGRLLLADGDVVEAHNLNRQIYTSGDVGHSKALCLQHRLRDIHPQAGIKALPAMLTPATIPAAVAAADLVLDCIDFLDVRAILALHAEARRQDKPVVSTFSMGWGAGVIVFRPDGVSLADMVGYRGELPTSHRELIQRLAAAYQDRIPPYVLEVLAQFTNQLKDGKPCPAPQLAVSTYMLAGMAIAAAMRIVLGLPVPCAPEPMYFDSSIA